jgi:hypothetical protein
MVDGDEASLKGLTHAEKRAISGALVRFISQRTLLNGRRSIESGRERLTHGTMVPWRVVKQGISRRPFIDAFNP